jgi:hypothetical protein
MQQRYAAGAAALRERGDIFHSAKHFLAVTLQRGSKHANTTDGPF